MNPNLPVLIVGGGIVGLTLAQALKRANIPFLVFERDLHPEASQTGWAITIHWALAALESCLPQELFDRLTEIQVDPQQGIEDTGQFLFLDLATAEPKYVIPPSQRMRVHRKKLRVLLAQGLPIYWDKNLHSYTETSGSILAHFEDGTTVEGCLLVGADGSSSRTRRLLYAMTFDPDKAKLNELPVRSMGVTVKLTRDQAQPLRDIDPLLFQGSHPDTGVFFWYSILSTPEVNGSAGTGRGEFFEGQLFLSWKAHTGDDEVPKTHRERIIKMKAMAQHFEDRLRNAVWEIPDDAQALEVKLQDWPTQVWDGRQGKVTLVGDAAHAMTMYRGDAFNHGITDAQRLSDHIIASYMGGYDTDRLREAVESYEEEMRERTHDAVLLSRQACLDAHDILSLSPNSPLLSRRVVVEPAHGGPKLKWGA